MRNALASCPLLDTDREMKHSVRGLWMRVKRQHRPRLTAAPDISGTEPRALPLSTARRLLHEICLIEVDTTALEFEEIG